MRKLAVAVFSGAFALMALSADAKEWTKVRIGIEGAYPPFSEVTPDGELKGFDVDFALALCAEMKVECELVQQDWDGIIPALLAGKYDAIVASMSITEERKATVDFTDKYYNMPARFARRKGSGIEFEGNGLVGKVIGIQRGTTHDRYLSANFGDKLELKRYATQDEAYLDMTAGRIDVLLADSIAMDEGFLKTEAGADYEFFGPPLNDPRWYGEGVGIAVRQEDTDLRDKLNAAIAAVRENGVYEQVQGKYFDFDIYGD